MSQSDGCLDVVCYIPVFPCPCSPQENKAILKKEIYTALKNVNIDKALSAKIESKTEYTANSCLKKLDNLCPVYNKATTSSPLA